MVGKGSKQIIRWERATFMALKTQICNFWRDHLWTGWQFWLLGCQCWAPAKSVSDTEDGPGLCAVKAYFNNCTTSVLWIFVAEAINLISVMLPFSDLHGKNWLTPSTSTNCYGLPLNYRRIKNYHYHSKHFACCYYFYLLKQSLFHSCKLRIKPEMDKNLMFTTETAEPRLWKFYHFTILTLLQSSNYPTEMHTGCLGSLMLLLDRGKPSTAPMMGLVPDELCSNRGQGASQKQELGSLLWPLLMYWEWDCEKILS